MFQREDEECSNNSSSTGDRGVGCDQQRTRSRSETCDEVETKLATSQQAASEATCKTEVAIRRLQKGFEPLRSADIVARQALTVHICPCRLHEEPADTRGNKTGDNTTQRESLAENVEDSLAMVGQGKAHMAV